MFLVELIILIVMFCLDHNGLLVIIIFIALAYFMKDNIDTDNSIASSADSEQRWANDVDNQCKVGLGGGFYDGKGYWRSPRDGFYDGKGYWRSPGDGFYDGKGYWRSPGDGFYDGKGNWQTPNK